MNEPMFEVDGIDYYRKVGDSYVRIEGPVDTTPASGSEITTEEMEALEGMFFSGHDINLYLKGELSAKRLCVHLNAYILQAYRMGQPQPNAGGSLMATQPFPPQALSYPAHCLCGHSEYVYGWDRVELDYCIKTQGRFPCTACSIGPAIEFSREAQEMMPWASYEHKRDYMIRRLRQRTAGGN